MTKQSKKRLNNAGLFARVTGGKPLLRRRRQQTSLGLQNGMFFKQQSKVEMFNEIHTVFHHRYVLTPEVECQGGGGVISSVYQSVNGQMWGFIWQLKRLKRDHATGCWSQTAANLQQNNSKSTFLSSTWVMWEVVANWKKQLVGWTVNHHSQDGLTIIKFTEVIPENNKNIFHAEKIFSDLCYSLSGEASSVSCCPT